MNSHQEHADLVLLELGDHTEELPSFLVRDQLFQHHSDESPGLREDLFRFS